MTTDMTTDSPTVGQREWTVRELIAQHAIDIDMCHTTHERHMARLYHNKALAYATSRRLIAD